MLDQDQGCQHAPNVANERAAIDAILGSAGTLSCLCDALRIVAREGVMDGTDSDHVVDTLIPLVAEKAEALFEDVVRLSGRRL